MTKSCLERTYSTLHQARVIAGNIVSNLSFRRDRALHRSDVESRHPNLRLSRTPYHSGEKNLPHPRPNRTSISPLSSRPMRRDVTAGVSSMPRSRLTSCRLDRKLVSFLAMQNGSKQQDFPGRSTTRARGTTCQGQFARKADFAQ